MATIADTYCAVSFSYSAPPTVELTVSVDGLGQIWSSLLAANDPGNSWLREVVSIDLEAVSLLVSRQLSFRAGRVDGFGAAGMDSDLPLFVAMDNITLSPCIDCNTPGEHTIVATATANTTWPAN